MTVSCQKIGFMKYLGNIFIFFTQMKEKLNIQKLNFPRPYYFKSTRLMVWFCVFEKRQFNLNIYFYRYIKDQIPTKLQDRITNPKMIL